MEHLFGIFLWGKKNPKTLVLQLAQAQALKTYPITKAFKTTSAQGFKYKSIFNSYWL